MKRFDEADDYQKQVEMAKLLGAAREMIESMSKGREIPKHRLKEWCEKDEHFWSKDDEQITTGNN